MRKPDRLAVHLLPETPIPVVPEPDKQGPHSLSVLDQQAMRGRGSPEERTQPLDPGDLGQRQWLSCYRMHDKPLIPVPALQDDRDASHTVIVQITDIATVDMMKVDVEPAVPGDHEIPRNERVSHGADRAHLGTGIVPHPADKAVDQPIEPGHQCVRRLAISSATVSGSGGPVNTTSSGFTNTSSNSLNIRNASAAWEKVL